MLHRRPWALLLSLSLSLLVLAAGCAGDEGDSTTETTRSVKPPLVYVAVGASETVGTVRALPAAGG